MFTFMLVKLIIFTFILYPDWSFSDGSAGKESACNAGDLGLIHGLGSSSGEERATHSSMLTWRIPWTEEPGGLQFKGSQRVGHD